MTVPGTVSVTPAVVVEVAVIALPHAEWGETVAAIIVPAAGKELNTETLSAFLADKLAKFKIPRSYRFVEALPRTGSGKVLKQRLRDGFLPDETLVRSDIA